MGAGKYVGMGLWIAKKAGELQNSYELYQADQSADAALGVAAKLAEISAGVSFGVAAGGIVEAMQKTGLDRVFDSVRKDQGWTDYLKAQENWRNFSDYAAGEATD